MLGMRIHVAILDVWGVGVRGKNILCHALHVAMLDVWAAWGELGWGGVRDNVSWHAHTWSYGINNVNNFWSAFTVTTLRKFSRCHYP